MRPGPSPTNPKADLAAKLRRWWQNDRFFFGAIGGAALLAGFLCLLFLDYIPRALAIAPVLLISHRFAGRALERSRPRDSVMRRAGRLRLRPTLRHPRFSSAMVQGRAGMGRRLWLPRWIDGVWDFTAQGVRWTPSDLHTALGFAPFVIPWTELESVNPWRSDGAYQTWVRFEGSFGPPVEALMFDFDKTKAQFTARGVRVVDPHAARMLKF